MIALKILNRSGDTPPAPEQMRRGFAILRPAELTRTAVEGPSLEGSEAPPKATAGRAHLTEKRSGSLFRSLTLCQQSVLRAAALSPLRHDGLSWHDSRGRAFRVAPIAALRTLRLLALTTRGGLVATARGRQAVVNAMIRNPLAYTMHGYATRRLSEIDR